MSFAEKRSFLFITGQIVVQHDLSEFSVVTQPERIAAPFVGLLGYEQSPDQVFSFRQHAQRTQKVAVPQSPLQNVIRLDFVVENVNLASNTFWCPQPGVDFLARLKQCRIFRN